MAIGYNPRVVTDGLVLALDAGNVKSFNQIFAQGQAEFTTPGTYSWTAPVGVTSVCVVCIGAGGAGGAYGGGGGSLAYKNNISVTPGQSYSVEVGASNTATNETGGLVSTYAGLSSAFGTYAYGGRGGNIVSGTQGIGGNYDGGGQGGQGRSDFYQSGIGYKSGAGGGAGGYSGDGGDAGVGINTGSDGSGGGGGGGSTGSATRSFGGGGVGIYGEGTSGSGGVAVYNGGTGRGGGGSGGEDGIVRGSGSTVTGGGLYGGGGGGGNNSAPVTTGSNSGGGAVRIIWGSGRSFPSTNTVDVTPQSAAFDNWNDISGKGNNGTLTNGPTFDSGNGGSIVFDGTNDYVQLPASSDLDFGTGNFTLEGWFNKATTTTLQVLLCSNKYYTHSFNGNWILRISSATQIAFAAYDGTSGTNLEYAEFNASTSVDTWHHFALVREGTGTNETKFYLDGVLKGSVTVSKSLPDAGTNGLRIGEESDSGPGNAPFNGKISNVKIYKGKGLTATEVLQNYNTLKGRYGY